MVESNNWTAQTADFNTLLTLFKSEDIMSHYEAALQLRDSLTMAQESQLKKFPLDPMTIRLIEIVKQPVNAFMEDFSNEIKSKPVPADVLRNADSKSVLYNRHLALARPAHRKLRTLDCTLRDNLRLPIVSGLRTDRRRLHQDIQPRKLGKPTTAFVNWCYDALRQRDGLL